MDVQADYFAESDPQGKRVKLLKYGPGNFLMFGEFADYHNHVHYVPAGQHVYEE